MWGKKGIVVGFEAWWAAWPGPHASSLRQTCWSPRQQQLSLSCTATAAPAHLSPHPLTHRVKLCADLQLKYDTSLFL